VVLPYFACTNWLAPNKRPSADRDKTRAPGVYIARQQLGRSVSSSPALCDALTRMLPRPSRTCRLRTSRTEITATTWAGDWLACPDAVCRACCHELCRFGGLEPQQVDHSATQQSDSGVCQWATLMRSTNIKGRKRLLHAHASVENEP
jgi:hypothetical protein